MPLSVFISYAREDQAQALQYYELLQSEGFTPWIDVRSLLPGQNWEAEISKAFGDANVVMLLLSPRSVSKRGFVQREANDAIERLRYKQPTDIYVIPLLLEPCEVPSQIAGRLQYVDLTANGSWDRVIESLRLASAQQSIQLVQGVSYGPFTCFTERVAEQQEGCPGYEVEIDFPRFESASKPDAAKELSALFVGRAYEGLISERQKPWSQDPDLYAGREGTSKNGRWEGYGIVHSTSSLLSLTYEVGWYGAGAAHPNMHFETFNFAYSDRLNRLQLQDFFTDMDAALKIISSSCIQSLSREYWERTSERPDEEQLKWFLEGAGPALENFSAFTVGPDRFTFLFAPYEVSSYAMGRWAADVSYYELLDLFKQDGPHGLALPASSS
jgi:TIR domain/Protein of unknown function (DUF3298)